MSSSSPGSAPERRHDPALHHVQLAATAGSRAELRASYGGPLGMTGAAKPPALAARGGVWFSSGSAEVPLGIESDCRPARKAHRGLLAAAGSG